MNNRIACSVKEAAEAIGVCPNTIYKHIREGRIDATRVCGRRFVTVDSLKRLTGAQVLA